MTAASPASPQATTVVPSSTSESRISNANRPSAIAVTRGLLLVESSSGRVPLLPTPAFRLGMDGVGLCRMGALVLSRICDTRRGEGRNRVRKRECMFRTFLLFDEGSVSGPKTGLG